MKKAISLVLLLVLCSLLSAQSSEDKLWITHQSLSTPGVLKADVWFIQDRETGTRCYAFRAELHDGAAISCVAAK